MVDSAIIVVVVVVFLSGLMYEKNNKTLSEVLSTTKVRVCGEK